MRIGVTVPNVHESLAERTTIDAVGRMADELGFDSVWCNDHLAIPNARGDRTAEPAYAAAYGEQRGQSIYEPLIVLAYLAAVTRRVLLGTSVYLLPLRNPLLAARQAVSLDRLSGGRLVLGVGAGWLESEFAAVGVPYRQRGRRTDEAIAMLTSLCADDGAGFLPKPVQRPHPPIYLGGESPAALRRLVEYGDAWLPRARTSPEEIVRVRGWLADQGREKVPFTVFSAPPDPAVLAGYAEAGVDEVTLALPTLDEDATLRRLDELAAVATP